tara:strand:- start:35 stop:277 length:243 start_codon:yes stop_codon:yes gene_type:complete
MGVGSHPPFKYLLLKRETLTKENVMDKVWIVEEIREDMTTAIMGAHATLASARNEVLEWEAVEGNKCLYTITVMRVQGSK